ncbi:MAG: superoxide dismutase family protein [Phycisphaerales bacterium]|nr:superoxide dismutase family protein [Phycisphaerales bacterium]
MQKLYHIPLICCLLIACTKKNSQNITAQATATIAGYSSGTGSSIYGTATFSQYADGTVVMNLQISGYPTTGWVGDSLRGTHLHHDSRYSTTVADNCDGNINEATYYTHWNTTKKLHGDCTGGDTSHIGDIGNFTVSKNGTANFTKTVPRGWSIGGDTTTNIVGKVIVIHGGMDQYTVQPSGNSGARLACGVIELKN